MSGIKILGIVGSLRQILVTLDMPVVNRPEVMIGNAAQRFGQAG